MRDDTLRAVPFFPRAAAYLLDRLILALVMFIPRLVVLFRSMGTEALRRAVLFRFSAADIVLWVLAAAYFVLTTALTGATPGKRAMGLTVVTREGEKPDFLTVLNRETWARYLSSILCIGYILCLADPVNGTLHDRICDTRVVYAPPKERQFSAPPTRPVSAPPARPVSAPALPPSAEGGLDWYAPNR